jgi:hypothetical protein
VPITVGSLEPAQQHVAAHERLKIAVGKMEPIKVLGIVGMVRPQSQSTTAVRADDVVDDGRGFGQYQIAVADDRRIAEWVHLSQLGGRKPRDGVALIALDLIGNLQFFAEPHDAL